MSKFVGTGPSSYKKRIYRAAVSQKLGNTALEYGGQNSFHCPNVLNNDKFNWQLITQYDDKFTRHLITQYDDKFTRQLITQYDVQISCSTFKLKALQCVPFLKGDTKILRHTTRVEPVSLVATQKTLKRRFQDSPQIGRRFPLTKLPTFRRRSGQHLLNHFNFINFHNQLVVHITRWRPFQVSNTLGHHVRILTSRMPYNFLEHSVEWPFYVRSVTMVPLKNFYRHSQ